MSTQSENSPLAPIFKITLQIALLIAFWSVGTLIQNLFALPISGAVIGLFILLIGLLSGLFKEEWIKTGSDFLLAELVLLFIPCLIGMMNYKDLFLTEGWKLAVAVVIGTICVIVSTAYSVHFGFKLEKKLKQIHLHKSSHAFHSEK